LDQDPDLSPGLTRASLDWPVESQGIATAYFYLWWSSCKFIITIMEKKSRHVNRDFFARGTLTVACELLGQRPVRVLDGVRLSGRIVEVEAYIGEEDRASHAHCGRTCRNAPMYGPPGQTDVAALKRLALLLA